MCNVLHIAVFPFSFGHCVVCPCDSQILIIPMVSSNYSRIAPEYGILKNILQIGTISRRSSFSNLGFDVSVRAAFEVIGQHHCNDYVGNC